MTLTLAVAWWWGGLILGAIGAFCVAIDRGEHGSFGGWGYTTPSTVGWVGLLLCVLAVLYLVLGYIARSLP